jgi:protein-disulfide isomerase
MPDRNTGSKKPKDRNKNTMKAARSASSRPAGFYILLGILALAGVAVLRYEVTRPKKASQADIAALIDTTNAGPAQGHTYGKPDAPVKLVEFGDFECPQCARFSTLTEPDLRKRLVGSGEVSFTFYDFPIYQIHRNTQAASNAAACAEEQQKFWEMHDRIFDGQDQWNGEATDNPGKIFAQYAGQIGLNVDAWQKCFDAHKYQKRINANAAEGMRRGINATPTFLIGTRLHAGTMGFDELKAFVDSARAAMPPATASSSTPVSALKK